MTIPPRDRGAVPATTDTATPFKVGEPVSLTNPLPVTITGPYSAGEPVSQTNRLMVALTSPSFVQGAPVSTTNPLLVIIGGTPTSPGEALSKLIALTLTAVGTLNLTGAALAAWKAIGRSDISFNESSAPAGREVVESRVFFQVQADCTSLRFYAINKYVTALGVETAATSAATWTLAIETLGATQTVFASQGAVTLAAGDGKTLFGEIPSSAFSLAKFTKAEGYWARIRMEIPVAGKQLQFPGVGTPNATGEASFRGPTVAGGGTTQLGNTGPLNGTGLFALGSVVLPFEILGYTASTQKAWGCIGTSIPWGQGDAGGLNYGDGGPIGSNGRTVQGGGFRRAAYTAGVAMIMLARQSTTAQSYVSSYLARSACYIDIDKLLVEMATNDLNGGAATATQLKDWLETIAANAKAINPSMLLYLTTCLPRTTDAITPFTGEAQRLVHNSNVRTGQIVGYTDFFDAAATVESTVTPGLWADGADTVDWTHPSAAGYAKITAGLATKLTAWS